jgi:phospholipid/cholesterol/gamma-HCH transport system substrate-binding protein
MENKSHALKAGIFTLILLIATILAALWLNRDRVQRVQYEMATTLPLQGLNPQATVRYRGLDVGRVDDILFDPEVLGQILVRLSVKPDTPVTESTFGMLNYQGVTGIAFIQLDDDGSKPRRLSSSEGKVPRIPLRPSLLDNLQNKGLEILEQTQVLTRQLNTLFNPANQKTIMSAFENVSQAADKIEQVPKKLEPTLERLPALAAQAEKTLASISALSENAGERTDAVSSAVEYDTLPRINQLTNEARTSLHVLNRTLEQFNRNPQSVLFGSPAATPGPGEPGFAAPEK